jgi:hypothetical protein
MSNQFTYHITGKVYETESIESFGTQEQPNGQFIPFNMLGEYYFSLNLGDSENLSETQLHELFSDSIDVSQFANTALQMHSTISELAEANEINNYNHIKIYPTEVSAEVYETTPIKRAANGGSGSQGNMLTEYLFLAKDSCIDGLGYYTKEALHEVI